MNKAATLRQATPTKKVITKSLKTASSSKPQTSEARSLRVGRELLDTTWRMAVPVVLFASLGIALDRKFGSDPWITLGGMIVGFLFAGLLVKQQLERWPADVKPGKYKNYYKDEDNKDYYND